MAQRRPYYSKSLASIIVLLMITFDLFGQQKVQFSQYMFSGMVINPAYAGADEALSLTFINRRQWANIENAPTTQMFTGHTAFLKKHVGLGLSVVNDKIGVHRNTSVLTTYAYHLKTSHKNSYLSMGIQAGMHNRKSDYASLLGDSQYDPKISNANISNTFFDFGVGLYFRSKKFHAGFSIPELIPERLIVSDSVSIEMSKANLFIFSKYKITLNEVFDVEPSLLIKSFSGVPLSFDINSNFIYKKVLTMGISYRKSESIDFLFKAQITEQLQAGYAYDHTIGNVRRLGNGSHELMINYIFKYVKTKVPSPR